MEKTKQKILEVAVDLFSQKGFSGVSIREITRNVGIKESSLYNHFQSKDDILTQILDFYQAEIEKTTPSQEQINQKISTIPAQTFWQKGLTNFQQATQAPIIQKISKIILLEMFQNQRARDIALNEFFTRQQKITETIFSLMQKKELIKSNLDPKILATEYTYAMLAMQFEYNILKNWNQNTDKVQQKMLNHIKFISEYAKSTKGS